MSTEPLSTEEREELDQLRRGELERLRATSSVDIQQSVKKKLIQLNDWEKGEAYKLGIKSNDPEVLSNLSDETMKKIKHMGQIRKEENEYQWKIFRWVMVFLFIGVIVFNVFMNDNKPSSQTPYRRQKEIEFKADDETKKVNELYKKTFGEELSQKDKDAYHAQVEWEEKQKKK